MYRLISAWNALTHFNPFTWAEDGTKNAFKSCVRILLVIVTCLVSLVGGIYLILSYPKYALPLPALGLAVLAIWACLPDRESS